MKLKEAMDKLKEGESLRLTAALSFRGDLEHWAEANGFSIVTLREGQESLEAEVIKGRGIAQTAAVPSQMGHSVAIVLFSNDLDKAMAALILANGLAASGAKVGIFFTFWGLSVLRKHPQKPLHKSFISKLFGWMLPNGAQRLALSKMNMMGMGTAMMKAVMAKKKVLSVPELLEAAHRSGVRFIACDMAMDIMGITKDELIDVDEVAGVAAFARLAKDSNNTLFI